MPHRPSERSLLCGPILPGMFLFFLPLLGGYAVTAAGEAVNTWLLGRVIGDGALAAVSAATRPLTLLVAILSGLVVGLRIALCRRFGRQDAEAAFRCAVSGVFLILFVGAALGLSALLWMRPLLSLMQTPADILEDSVLYGVFSCLSAAVTYTFQGLVAVFGAAGRGRTVMLFNALSILFRIAYSTLFVLVLRIGLGGILLSALCADLTACLFCLPLLGRSALLARPAHRPFAPHSGCVREILSLGLPIGLQTATTTLGALVLQAGVNAYLGTDYISATAAAGPLVNWLLQPICLWGTALQVFCGQNLGAHNRPRARKGVRLSLLVCVGWALCAVGLSLLLSGRVAGFFSGRTDILPTAALYANITVGMFPLVAVFNTLREAMFGDGHTRSSILGGLAETAGNAFAGAVLIPHIGLPGALSAKPLSWVLSFSVFVIAYLIYLRKTNRAARPADGAPEKEDCHAETT